MPENPINKNYEKKERKKKRKKMLQDVLRNFR